MAKSSDAKMIGKIKKRDDVEIYASISSYRNELYVDFREYIQSPNYSGPTRKGIRFHVENWEGFKDLVKQVDEELQKLG